MGKTNNGPFIQKAIDEASAKGGGKVIIPPGNFASGVLILKSGVNLHLEPGACLLGSVKRADYNNPIAMAFLVAKDQKNISITGEGVIDGQAGELMLDVFRMLRAGTLIDNGGWSVRPSEGIRPMLVQIRDCDQINISGVTLKDAASWVQDYFNCTNLTIDGIKVQSTSYWNNDGIDYFRLQERKSDQLFRKRCRRWHLPEIGKSRQLLRQCLCGQLYHPLECQWPLKWERHRMADSKTSKLKTSLFSTRSVRQLPSNRLMADILRTSIFSTSKLPIPEMLFLFVSDTAIKKAKPVR